MKNLRMKLRELKAVNEQDNGIEFDKEAFNKLHDDIRIGIKDAEIRGMIIGGGSVIVGFSTYMMINRIMNQVKE